MRELITRRQLVLGSMTSAASIKAGDVSIAAPANLKHDVPRALPNWLRLPATPDLPKATRQELASINGTQVFFAQFGNGPQVLLLHGGLANSNYWGHQIDELAQHFTVTVLDTRGHGRSPVTSGAFSYDLFARDAVGLMDFLEIARAAIIGWSDGAITGIQLALTNPNRVSALFAFGANADLDGLKSGGSKTGVFPLFASRCRGEYLSLSPHPERWGELQRGLSAMWRREPNFTRSQLGAIRLPVTIADGEHDEIIKLEHTRRIAASIKDARLEILPDASHFAMLQTVAGFNRTLIEFLGRH